MGTIHICIYKWGISKTFKTILYIIHLAHFSIETYAFWLPPVGNPQITRNLPIAAKTAWDIVPEEKVYNAAAVRGESVLSMVFTKVFVCIYADLPK